MRDESEGVEALIAALDAAVDGHLRSKEILCVDDGSGDDTCAAIEAIQASRPDIVLVQLSRHFGKESAMAAGLSEARGEAVVFIDADLQHPPALIPQMLEAWRAGADVVEGVKQRRGREPLMHRLSAGLFNAVSGRSIGRSLDGASDFKLLDRQVVTALLGCDERHRFFRGLVAWVGFEVVQLPFDVAERSVGRSSWSTLQLMRFALRNLLAFTALPLHMVAGAGAVALLFSVLLGTQTLYRYLSGTALGGFTTVILLQLLLSGILLASVGVVALYVAELYVEAKARPVFIVRRARTAVSRGTGSSGAGRQTSGEAAHPPPSGDGPEAPT